MNNYEQRVFLNYLTKLIDDIDLDSYTFDNVFSFFLKEFKVDKTLFELDERDELILDKASQFRQFKKTFRRVLNDIQKKMPVRNTSIERKLNILSYYAKYLADRLGIEVILKKASDLISPYVGETEQNIAAAFSEAKSKKAMLIFDEADTFLQDRNNAVRSWEVAQVNEMLTQMESAEYPFVCTTNLLDTLDEASLRRFTFKIKFDFMTQEQVNLAIEHFFGIKNTNVNLNGLTAGDFATVKKKTDFLGVNNLDEIVEMLKEEIKVKKSKTLQNSVGF